MQTLAILDPSDANVTDSAGNTVNFTNKDINGRYLAPGSFTDALQQTAQGWILTQSDGFQTFFPGPGTPAWLADTSGGRWTLSYDAGGRLVNLRDPHERRTTWAYDGRGYIQRIQDTGGRLTSLTVDPFGNLTRRISPDGAITTLSYDTSHRLKLSIDPLAFRTSYSYDLFSRIQSITKPTGCRTTYAYFGNTVGATDATGQRTTVLYDSGRYLVGLINPVGARTTYILSAKRLNVYIDPNNHRNTPENRGIQNNAMRYP